jgi:hypothetical protein
MAWVVAVCASMAITSLPVRATTLATTDVEEIASIAEAAAEGVVLSVEFQVRNERLVTVALFSVTEAWGSLTHERHIHIVSPGGRDGDYVTVVPGAAQLRPGDRLFILLSETPLGWQPTALGWSVFDASRSAQEPAPRQQGDAHADDLRTLAELRAIAHRVFPRLPSLSPDVPSPVHGP